MTEIGIQMKKKRFWLGLNMLLENYFPLV